MALIRQELAEIYETFGLDYLDDEGEERSFTEVLAQIYLDWNKHELQRFMDAILSIEMNGGGDPFGTVNYSWGAKKRIGF